MEHDETERAHRRTGGNYTIDAAAGCGEPPELDALLRQALARVDEGRQASAATHAAVRAAADALPFAIVTADDQGQVLTANRAAWSAALPELAAMTRALAARLDGHEGPVTLTWTRPGRRPLEILATRARHDADPFTFPITRITLIIVDPEHNPGPDLETLMKVYKLTPAEARLATRLLLGDSVSDAALALGIKISTARTHLARIFGKTGTSRQADLIRHLSMLPAAPKY